MNILRIYTPKKGDPSTLVDQFGREYVNPYHDTKEQAGK